jgi:uncharacterized protein
VKLIVREAHSAAMFRWQQAREDRVVTSNLAETEVLRAVRRTDAELTERARAVISTLDVIALEAAHLERAGSMLPAGLRTLDALHLAVALDLVPGLLGFVTYDDRQAHAAREHAIRVVRPT